MRLLTGPGAFLSAGPFVAVRLLAATGLLVSAGLLVAGCGDRVGERGRGPAGPGSSGASEPKPTSAPKLTGTVTVFAAASLTESFTTLGRRLEAGNPGAKVIFNFAGSSALATQINQGAPADVFASAAPATMKTVTDAGGADGAPTTFVKNQLVIAVGRGNPKGVGGLADLARRGIKVALCAEQVPCGAAAKKALTAAGVTVTPVTREQDVKAALSKVRLGEVDAALVYRTDVRAAGADVRAVEFPESASAINEYPIVVLRKAPNRAGAAAFVAYVRSPGGMAVLTAAGFQIP